MKIGKISIREISDSDRMSDKEMKNVKGGSGVRCCCGMGAGDCFDALGGTIDDGIKWVIKICPSGGGCFETTAPPD